MRQRIRGILGCMGAIIGAGFVSGREVVSFFSRYGIHSWWLIALSVITMIFLCALCLRFTEGKDVLPLHASCFSEKERRRFSLVLLGILFLLAGSMASAAAHMIALVIPFRYAYLAGLVGTICIAWLLSKGNMKPYTFFSFLLTALFSAVLLWALRLNAERTVMSSYQGNPAVLLIAAISAIGYGAMNIAVSLGVLCRNRGKCSRENDHMSVCLGCGLGVLMILSNLLFLRRTERWETAFPILGFFEECGIIGYILCVVLLYLAILTSLVALMCTLRSDLEETGVKGWPLTFAVLGAPAAISLVGFADIVDHLYAPSGLICLMFIFFPIMRKQMRKSY